jgi:hypothetical protein
MSLRRWIRSISQGFCLSALVLACLAWSNPALAWIEITLAGDDVKLDVERSGMCVVEHALTLRLRGGPLRAFTLQGIDLDATLEGEATVTALAHDGVADTTTPMGVTIQPDGGARLDFPDGKGLGKGTYIARFKYRTDLAKSGALERDGTMVRARWLGPKLPNGLDTARVTFSFPTAPSEPRAAGDRRDGDLPEAMAISGAGAFLTTLRRLPDHDELELSRPHVARGEQVAWSARVDPRALGGVNDPKIKPPAAAMVQNVVRESPMERQVFMSVGIGVALLFIALTAIKGRQVELAAKELGARARPVIPLPVPLRAIAAGLFFAAGVATQLFAHPPAIGSVLIAVAMLLMAHRTPAPRVTARAPGRFLAVSDDEAFAKPARPRDTWLDASTRSGVVALVVALAILGGTVWLTWTVSPYHAPIAALDGLALLALFATGRRSELVPAAGRGGVPQLSRIAARLRQEDASLRVVPWARFPQGEAQPDDLRVLVMPKTATRGLISIEIGYAYAVGEGGTIACPQVLVRVAGETLAAERAQSLMPLGRWVAGRRAGERVLTLEPRLPTWRATAALALSVARALTETAQPTKAARGAGKGASAEKAATSASPLQVTDAAWSA